MPWAAYRVLDDQPLSKRPAVMGACGTDREDFLAAAGQQHRLVVDLTHKHRAIGEIAFGNTVRQVWLVLACVWHLTLPATRVAASPPSPEQHLIRTAALCAPSRPICQTAPALRCSSGGVQSTIASASLAPC